MCSRTDIKRRRYRSNERSLGPRKPYVSGHDWSRLLVSTCRISSVESARHPSRGEKSLTDAQPARVRRTRVASSLRKISFSRNEVRGRSLSRITHSGDCFYTPPELVGSMKSESVLAPRVHTKNFLFFVFFLCFLFSSQHKISP